jgi:RimJ/RimL family protein N-acetyltransferase
MQAKTFTLAHGQMLVVREADSADAAALLAFVQQVADESDYLTFGPGEFTISEAEEAEFLAKLRAADNQLYLIAELGGEIVGTLHFTAGQRPRVRHSGELGMSVRKPYWGLGIGSRLLEVLIAWAAGTGVITKLNLRVRADNQRALALYRRYGFTEEGRLSRELFLNGSYYDLIWMGRSVEA